MSNEKKKARGGDRAHGQILVPVLLGAVPLTALLWVVMRSGPAVRDRVQLQTAADAAALAGAAWEARACNLLAQAHQTEAQLAAGIALLRAVEPARAAAEAVLDALQTAKAAPPAALAAERQLLRDWQSGLSGLAPLAEVGNADGLWAAAETVETLKKSVLQALPGLVAQDATAFGIENGATEIHLWPAYGALPVEEAPASDLRDAAQAWLARGLPRLAAGLRPPLLSDARTLYQQRAVAELDGLLADAAFPARPLRWRADARRGLDRVAVALRARDGHPRETGIAQARPANPLRGDLATAGWIARLVPALRAGEAWSGLALPGTDGRDAAARRLSPETVDALMCH